MEDKYLTVTALTKYIKYKFDNDRHLFKVYLKGEISNFKKHSRGHFYFTLKDDYASIQAMMFNSDAQNVNFDISDGKKVLVCGSISVYEPYGTYQITVKEMSLDGIGELFLAYEKLKKDLESQGLFDLKYKKPIPLFPKKIGVITSPTGAAIKDILNTIKRRYPICEVILYPALVQGEFAKKSIATQINKANKDKLVDVLIVGRGGGSIEDLWAFNEKEVAMAIFASQIPVISAVGHEIDFTISDFVADKRAATPTAAAEMATPNKDDLLNQVNMLKQRLNIAIDNYLNQIRMQLLNIDNKLDNLSPHQLLNSKKQELMQYQIRLNNAFIKILDVNRNILKTEISRLNQIFDKRFTEKARDLQLLTEKLKVLNPLTIIDKGYSIARCNNKIIKSVNDVKTDDIVDLKVSDGTIKCKVL